MTNNTVDLKYRKRFCDSFTFQTFASMKWGLGGQKEKQNILLNVFHPEKMVFAFTHERVSDDKMHKLKPFCGL